MLPEKKYISQTTAVISNITLQFGFLLFRKKLEQALDRGIPVKLKVMYLHQRGLFISVLGLRSLAETKLCCTWNGGDDFSPLCGKVRVSVQGCGSTAHQLIFTAHHPTSQAGQWRKYLYFLFLNSISNYASCNT